MADLELDEAKGRIRNAWICGLIVAAVNLAIGFVFGTNENLKSLVGANAEAMSMLVLFEVVLIAILSLGVMLRSRFCAILLFTDFALSKVALLLDNGSLRGLPVAIFFGFWFFQGVRGTFTYHAAMTKSGAARKSIGGALMAGLGVLVVFIFFGLHVGLMIVSPENIPWDRFVPKSWMASVDSLAPAPEAHETSPPREYVAKIDKLKLLDQGEELKAVYSIPGLTPEDGFYAATDRKLAIYSTAAKDRLVVVPFSAITGMNLEKAKGAPGADQQIRLTYGKGARLNVLVTSKGGRGERFYGALRREWESHAAARAKDVSSAAPAASSPSR